MRAAYSKRFQANKQPETQQITVTYILKANLIVIFMTNRLNFIFLLSYP